MSSPSSSMSTRISSAMPMAGCVSLSWMATLSAKRVESLVVALVAPDDVVDGAGDEEVLLPQPELLAGLEVVVRVEDLGDDLGGVLRLHGAHVVAGVEQREVEVLARAGRPEAERVDRVRMVARRRGCRRGRPWTWSPGSHTHPEAPLTVADLLGAAAERDRDGVLGPLDLPRVAEAQPLVGALDLAAVADHLLEDAELVADAVALARGDRASPSTRGGTQRGGRDRRSRGPRRTRAR